MKKTVKRTDYLTLQLDWLSYIATCVHFHTSCDILVLQPSIDISIKELTFLRSRGFDSLQNNEKKKTEQKQKSANWNGMEITKFTMTNPFWNHPTENELLKFLCYKQRHPSNTIKIYTCKNKTGIQSFYILLIYMVWSSRSFKN